MTLTDRISWRRRFSDSYGFAALLIFIIIVVCCWTGYLLDDEELYLVGSHRLADPSFLAYDFTWSHLPPTSALFDHLVAPLWRVFDAFTIVNIGRLVFWILWAWSITLLARTIRLPAWAAVVGTMTWLLWTQNIAACGAPLYGFQVKSLAYPLIFFAIAFAMRGHMVRAGAAAGLGAAFHIIVGGWGCLALFLSILLNRKLFTWRDLTVFLLATAPFVLPVVFGVASFYTAHVTQAEQARMDQVYSMFAMPRCCDVFFFMGLDPHDWPRAAIIFPIASVIVIAWPERREAKILGGFLAAVILFFLGGMLARAMNLYAVLKLFPFQLASALPAMFLFMFVAGWIGVGGATRRFGWAVWILVLAGTSWLFFERQVPERLIEAPQEFAEQVGSMQVSPYLDDPLLAWIRNNAPRDGVFITPFLPEFWFYAQRAQVASMRHPPLDHRLLEWKERLEAMNGFRPYTRRGIENAKELEVHESQLPIADLIRIRERYGATHFVARGTRADLARHFLHADSGYSIYDITSLAPTDRERR